MKVLVTGASGFLGQVVCRKLIDQGYSVVGLGRRLGSKTPLQECGVEYRQVDLGQRKELENVLNGVNSVIHCAALSSTWGKYQDFYASNVLGTENLAKLCLERDINRFVHVSSPSIYFQMRDRLNIGEQEPLPKHSINDYAKTKLLAESVIDKAVASGLPAITIRPQAIFGPHDPAIIPRLILSNDSTGIPLPKNKKIWIDITYVDNVADSLLLALHAPTGCIGKKYNITNGEAIELRSFLQDLFKLLNRPFKELSVPFPVIYSAAQAFELFHKLLLPNREPRLTKYSVGVLNFNRTLDITAARAELGYVPKVSVEEGVRHFLNWWKSSEADFKGKI